MLKNKNNFDIINSFFHCKAENFSEHPRIGLGVMAPSATLRQVLQGAAEKPDGFQNEITH
jgi:hypothetical protein